MSKEPQKPDSISAMAFYHSDGLVPAWHQAMRFAGEGGRITTLPDIIEARLKTEPGSTPWERYFTTTTAEYMGRTRKGVRILIVAHGVGPMATLDGIVKAYSHEFKDKTRSNRGGKISYEEWYKLESGYYGDVSVVDMDQLIKRYEYPFIEILTSLDAYSEPLLEARFGLNAAYYIDRHRKIAIEWHREQAGIDPPNRYNLQGHGQYLNRRRIQHTSDGTALSDPYILKMGDAANCSYLYSTLEAGSAFAHLISIGGLMHCNHQDGESLVCDVDCHEWGNGTRFVGLKSGTEISDIHPGYENIRSIIHKNWRKLFKQAGSKNRVGLRPLVRVGENWFTQYVESGVRLDSHEPEYRVTSLNKIGGPVEFVTPIWGYYGFFQYDVKQVKAIAPPKANVYVFVSEPKLVPAKGGSEHQRVRVQFYEADIDTSQRLIREHELQNDCETLMSFVTKDGKTGLLHFRRISFLTADCGDSAGKHALSATFEQESVDNRCPKCHKAFEELKVSGHKEPKPEFPPDAEGQK